MSGFDFIFALFSLLLGLAIAELFSGFARAIRVALRRRHGGAGEPAIGWLVPLLAVHLLLGQLAFWSESYNLRDSLPFNYVTLMVETITVGGYYLLATLVWPDDAAQWPDFDAYYDRYKRVVLTGNLLLFLIASVFAGIYDPGGVASRQAGSVHGWMWLAVAGSWMGLLLNVALIFVRAHRANVALLAILIAAQVVGSIAVTALASP